LQPLGAQSHSQAIICRPSARSYSRSRSKVIIAPNGGDAAGAPVKAVAGRWQAGAVPVGDLRTPEGANAALEDLAIAGGLSVRDIEDAFRDESGRLLLSRTAVSEIGARLWPDYQEFAGRDLSEYDITYLFIDGIAERLRPGQRREPVLAAWGHPAAPRSCCI
jgi:hypothetical protein